MRGLLLLLCAAHAETGDAHYLEGYWYAETYQASIHQTMQDLEYYGSDGSVEVEFRLYKNCRLVQQARRPAVGPRRRTAITSTLSMWMRDRQYHDDYVVETSIETAFTSRHVQSGIHDHSERVKKDLVFPACGT